MSDIQIDEYVCVEVFGKASKQWHKGRIIKWGDDSPNVYCLIELFENDGEILLRYWPNESDLVRKKL